MLQYHVNGARTGNVANRFEYRYAIRYAIDVAYPPLVPTVQWRTCTLYMQSSQYV